MLRKNVESRDFGEICQQTCDQLKDLILESVLDLILESVLDTEIRLAHSFAARKEPKSEKVLNTRSTRLTSGIRRSFVNSMPISVRATLEEENILENLFDFFLEIVTNL